ncbi:hypothetical protein [Acetobacter sp. LMG 32666]|uniref:hypothetical protein n=1 Tax=Acetobacter sp. LMG 32666 TaxID=2959295 RepID=UPI0030C80CBE
MERPGPVRALALLARHGQYRAGPSPIQKTHCWFVIFNLNPLPGRTVTPHRATH